MEVTVRRTAHAAAVPSIGGIGGYVLQDAVTEIRTHTGARIVVAGTQVRLVTSLGEMDLTEQTPAHYHDAIVAYWQQEAERWAAEVAHPSQAEVIEVHRFEIDGRQVNAPGFTPERFARSLARAKEERLRTTPGDGCVLVTSGSSDARYRVTRTSCECAGHLGHGYCKHRALVIWLVDVLNVNVMTTPVIGVSKRGVPLTTGRKPATSKAVAS